MSIDKQNLGKNAIQTVFHLDVVCPNYFKLYNTNYKQ